ncbi:TIGR03086 family metal-binding protein [Rhodococcus gannanensis]|uniref:TIGR03086 family metal-binding protein n=1 Tax=Rhodococcus gannanensis TaxID=1960308 RepID=A0ABW4P124_9NOCA
MTLGVLPVTDPLALLGAAVRYTDASLRAVRPDDLLRPTPCSEWNLAQLLAHMDESLAVLEEAVLDRSVLLRPVSRGGITSDPVAALRDRACRMMRSWERDAAPGGVRVGDAMLPAEIAAAAGALDVAVHGWDVGRALGLAHPLPVELATELEICAALFVSEADRPERFGPPIPVPPWAGPGERLLALLGRDGSR